MAREWSVFSAVETSPASRRPGECWPVPPRSRKYLPAASCRHLDTAFTGTLGTTIPAHTLDLAVSPIIHPSARPSDAGGARYSPLERVQRALRLAQLHDENPLFHAREAALLAWVHDTQTGPGAPPTPDDSTRALTILRNSSSDRSRSLHPAQTAAGIVPRQRRPRLRSPWCINCSQPSDILGTALHGAHPSISQVSPDVTPSHSRSGFQCCASGSVCAPPPLPVPGSASLLRPAPLDSAQAPNSKRHASSADRWYCLVQSCPDHCHHSSSCWSSFNATTGHGDRHFGGFLEGGLTLDWLEGAGYGVRQVCNRFRGKCPSCWPPSSSPNHSLPQGARPPKTCLHSIRSLAHGSACDLRSPSEPGISGADASTQPSQGSSPTGIPGHPLTSRLS